MEASHVGCFDTAPGWFSAFGTRRLPVAEVKLS